MSESFDLVVIGAGPAGEKGAVQAAYFGKRVAIVEKEPTPGGAAVHTGTLPSKTLRESALYLSGYRARDLYGIAVELEPDATLPRLMARKTAIAQAEAEQMRANLERHGVEIVYGRARLLDGHRVQVVQPDGTSRLLEGRYVLLATGSVPRRPEDIDFDDTHVHDSDEILTLERLPRSLVVLGGGVIGCEYACMFAALGVRVTLVDTRPQILPFLDAEIVQRLCEAMGRLGIEMRLGRRWERVARQGERIVCELSGGERLESEDVLFAAGRVGATAGLGLEEVGVRCDARGYVVVDECFRTSVPTVLAAGDVVGFPMLASTAMEQARVAVCRAFGFAYKQTMASLLPYGIYTIPECSAVGETEQGCRDKGIAYVAGRALYRDNARGKITGDLEGITKLVVAAADRRVLGVHVVGERASELVHIGQAVIAMGGTVDVFIDMVFNYPTLAESYKYAAYDCLRQLATRSAVR
ncbi:MAG: Si-specific NAD(P)(+) transhydrogenase [Myxococcota bacterium]|nr:Si-specific NAD(P)(+) transhydrogenase [Myxococcota bacterium]MDW8362146.1 Si-specific NAD(P)(+) transhydrogenase [Myxococcales bacterium]